MTLRLLLLPAILVTLLTGCRRDPYLQVYIDNMNAEKRMLEDTLYDLQHDYDCKVTEVERLQRELSALKTGGLPGEPRKDRSTLSPGSQAPRNLFPQVPDLEPPTIDEGEMDAPNSPPHTPEDPQSDQGPQTDDGESPDDLEPPKLDLGDADDSVSAVPHPSLEQITELHLDPARTGGWQMDDEPGDDGIRVVLQPRNEQHQYVPSPGRVSVVLLDEQTRERVARWEFTSADTEMALQKAQAGQGIELTMPWQDSPPEHSRLRLFVRYWLPDGQVVQQDREINVTPSGRLAARWMPRSLPRVQRPAPEGRVANDLVEDATDSASNAAGQNPRFPWQGSTRTATAPTPQAQRPEWRPYR